MSQLEVEILMTAGLILAIYWFFADQLEKPLKGFLDFTERNQRTFLIVSIAFVGLAVFNVVRRDN